MASSPLTRTRNGRQGDCSISGIMGASVREPRRCALSPTLIACAEQDGTGPLMLNRIRRRNTMAGRRSSIPSSVTIRMYNVGFGDCFLLTFHYAKKDRHVLIDYGSTAAPRTGAAGYMTAIATDIKNVC